jgi:putative sarcosine oxidase gamma subunit
LYKSNEIRNIMEIIKLTKKEEEWIKELKKLIRKKPKNLILFADGNLNILKLDKDDNDGVGENGRMKSDRIVEIILNACDGGVF